MGEQVQEQGLARPQAHEKQIPDSGHQEPND